MSVGSILLVCPHLPPTYQGGIEIHSSWLIDSLSRREPRLVVIYLAKLGQKLSTRDSLQRRTQRNVTYVEVSINDRYMVQPESYFFNDPVYDAVISTIHEYKPRAVLIQGGFRITSAAALAAQRCGVGYSVILHDFFYFCPKVNLLNSRGENCPGDVTIEACAACVSKKLEITGEVMEDWMDDERGQSILPRLIGDYRNSALRALTFASNVFAPSLYVKNKYSELIPTTRPVIVRIGVPEIYVRTSALSPSRRPRLAYLGHLHPHKGVHVLIEALTLLCASDRPSMKIYGHLDKYSAYHRQLRCHCDRVPDVHICGEYQFSDLRRIIEQIDVVVVPSLWQENSPLVIMMALRFGIPVIATKVGGVPEMITDYWNGLLVEAGSAVELASAISRLTRNRDEISIMSENARYQRTTEDETRELLRML